MTILNSAPVPQVLPSEVPAGSEVLTGDLSHEETRILAHLRGERPDLVAPFLAHLDRGRRGILHRLLQAAIRENIAGAGNLTEWLDDGRTLWVALLGGGALFVPVTRRLSLGRLDFGDEITLVGRGRPEPVVHPRRLL